MCTSTSVRTTRWSTCGDGAELRVRFAAACGVSRRVLRPLPCFNGGGLVVTALSCVRGAPRLVAPRGGCRPWVGMYSSAHPEGVAHVQGNV
mmetsp:Transcript_9635/g.29201  ORF Transcript_9635/g.29201 Transcript_9635/m.29201 type:complete len:91 (-) Transcript_9635:625-897(-)|eukprot:365066-Chlamydomonas_euryale.AAC.4